MDEVLDGALGVDTEDRVADDAGGVTVELVEGARGNGGTDAATERSGSVTNKVSNLEALGGLVVALDLEMPDG